MCDDKIGVKIWKAKYVILADCLQKVITVSTDKVHTSRSEEKETQSDSIRNA